MITTNITFYLIYTNNIEKNNIMEQIISFNEYILENYTNIDEYKIIEIYSANLKKRRVDGNKAIIFGNNSDRWKTYYYFKEAGFNIKCYNSIVHNNLSNIQLNPIL